MSTYLPGSFVVVGITGRIGTLITLGERVAGAAAVDAKYCHAAIITSADGDLVEAEPGGARTGHISEYDTEPQLVSDGPIQKAMALKRRTLASLQQNAPQLAAIAPSADDLEASLRAKVVATATALVGTPYSALDYVALAALHLHIPSQRIRDRVASSGHMICSQLVDEVYRRVGIELFTHRRPGDVMPSDLAAWIRAYDAMQRHPAGRRLVPAPRNRRENLQVVQ